nr:sugar phosphate transporter domain-containing protein [Tanacetum cinerariifolium]
MSEGSARWLYFSENNDEVTEQLRASVDFPVDLCDSIPNPDDANFTNWSHQAVDFILGWVTCEAMYALCTLPELVNV